MRTELALILVAGLASIAMCGKDTFDKGDGTRGPASASTLGIHHSSLPSNLREQARQALAGDARRREQRFIEATNPGRTFATTRVAQKDIDHRRVTPEALFQMGGQLFHHRFSKADGFGSKDAPGLRRVQAGRRGGPDAYRCSDCHRRGGPAGAGDSSDNAYYDGDGDDVTTALERNPPPLHGAGVIELLAREMTQDLRKRRREGIAEARKTRQPFTVTLETKGVNFGKLHISAEGKVDARDVQGVDPDLVVKPFGWKGHHHALRAFIEDKLHLHHGMQSSFLAMNGDPKQVGGFDPTRKKGGSADPDGDGVRDEITEGQLTALTLFVAMQEIPQVGMPNNPARVADWTEGQQLFDKIGCADCHRPSLPLESTIYTLPARQGGATMAVDLAKQGAQPRLKRAAAENKSTYPVYLYSDLKRHVVGPNLREGRAYRGVSAASFRTPPLWGIARSRPYLHDARAPELEIAITEHSGQAQRSRNAYLELDANKRGKLRVFLASLTRAPRIVAQ